MENLNKNKIKKIKLNAAILFFLVAKLLYKSKCPSVCPLCQPRLGGNVMISAPNRDIAPIFFVQIPLINEHLFCKYFVHLSVGNATKGFATYGCFHPCLNSTHPVVNFVIKCLPCPNFAEKLVSL